MERRQAKVKRQPRAKAAQAPARRRSKVAPKKAASRKPARKAAVRAAAKRRTPAAVEPVAAVQEPKPQAFWDPHGRQADFPDETKAHTTPPDQRAHIRMKAPRTWANRQPGRG